MHMRKSTYTRFRSVVFIVVLMEDNGDDAGGEGTTMDEDEKCQYSVI
jgi:hypothetical protein